MDFAYKKLDASCFQDFTDHLKIPCMDIQCTTEWNEEQAIAFLHTNTVPKEDSSVKVTIYKKPTLLNQYLNSASNHPLEKNISMVKTLQHKATVVITEGTD